ncbi:hypothetical protein LTR37_002279 [Vermiconidia calcicola]|uniref:Uncharacterized protein n=1 Tax=Vermiconidia calcicola TaxID=1690605 RepID=A0ACC3NTL9_9PEZI|nr:hypothetical protein LTR37_002279 [Vermiconidia calcicola]
MEPSCGTHTKAGPEAIWKTFGDVNTYWEVLQSNTYTIFSDSGSSDKLDHRHAWSGGVDESKGKVPVAGFDPREDIIRRYRNQVQYVQYPEHRLRSINDRLTHATEVKDRLILRICIEHWHHLMRKKRASEVVGHAMESRRVMKEGEQRKMLNGMEIDDGGSEDRSQRRNLRRMTEGMWKRKRADSMAIDDDEGVGGIEMKRLRLE